MRTKQKSRFWRREPSKNQDFGGVNQAKIEILAACTKQRSRFWRAAVLLAVVDVEAVGLGVPNNIL